MKGGLWKLGHRRVWLGVMTVGDGFAEAWGRGGE